MMDEVRRFKTLTFDLSRRAVEIEGVRRHLTKSEFDILEVLTGRPEVIFSRDRLMDALFGKDLGRCYYRSVDKHMQHLRRKGVAGIKASHGMGYFWEDRVDPPTKRTGTDKQTRTIIQPSPCCDYCGAPITIGVSLPWPE